jgi:hypothetical protein
MGGETLKTSSLVPKDLPGFAMKHIQSTAREALHSIHDETETICLWFLDIGRRGKVPSLLYVNPQSNLVDVREAVKEKCGLSHIHTRELVIWKVRMFTHAVS